MGRVRRRKRKGECSGVTDSGNASYGCKGWPWSKATTVARLCSILREECRLYSGLSGKAASLLLLRDATRHHMAHIEPKNQSRP